MIRRPPRSTLFPYTTALPICPPARPRPGRGRRAGAARPGHAQALGRGDGRGRALARSEEHTSELQSPCNIVCRLLLEKNNTQSLMTALLQYSTSKCILYV